MQGPSADWSRHGIPVYPVGLLLALAQSRQPFSRRRHTLTMMLAALGLLVAAVHAWAEKTAVVFTGLTPAQETNVRALLPLASATCETGRWRVQRLFRDADTDINRALEALGYYNASLDKALSWEGGCWRAEFKVEPGPAVHLRTVDFKLTGPAADDQTLRDSMETGRPRQGDILNHGNYENYRNKIRKALVERGYFEAEYSESRVIVDPQKLTAELRLQLDSGPRYRFGQISYSTDILSQDLLARYTGFKPGDYYSTSALTKLSTALSDSGYFASVSVSAEAPNRETGTIPVSVRLTPANRHVYTAGVGFATDTGPQVRLGYSNRRRNQQGHQFESGLFISPVTSEATASYRWPRRDPRKEWFNLAAGIKHEDTDTSKSDAYKVGVSRSRGIAAGRWLEKPYLELTYEDFEVAGEDGSSRLLIPGINWESISGRELGRTTRGRALYYDIRGASDQLGSDTSFLQIRAQGKWIRSLGAKTRVLLRANAGATLKNSLNELPPSIRFFAGGDRSVRGYDFEALGPRNSVGEVIGGAHLLDASIELDRIVRGNWSIAAFVDSGSAFNESPEFSTGAGLGLRWHSPVGPIRVDLATPLDDSDGGIRIHVSMGPDL